MMGMPSITLPSDWLLVDHLRLSA